MKGKFGVNFDKTSEYHLSNVNKFGNDLTRNLNNEV